MTSRIALILMVAATAAPTFSHAQSQAASSRTIPQKASARVIIDNDFAGDPDGLAALAHQLLTPKTRTVLVTSSALNPKFGGHAGDSAEEGRRIASELIQRLRITDTIPVVAGAEKAGLPTGDNVSAAARAIVAEAERDDPLPLFFTCGGPLTNLAAALRLQPAIVKRMTVVWIGGGPYPKGGWEYNLATDVDAARYVIEQSNAPLWQVPQNAYRQMQYSVAEMGEDLRPISAFTQWLYAQFTNPPSFVDVGGAWPLGDSPLVLLTAISQESSVHRDQPAHRITSTLAYGDAIPGRTVRVYETLDARLTFADFLAHLRRNAREGAAAPIVH